MIWECQWCGHPREVPAINPVAYFCDKCGSEAGGVFDDALPVQDLTEDERELVDVRVIWSGIDPDSDTLRALRSLDPRLRDESLALILDALRRQGYHSLGVHSRHDAQRVADEARLRGFHVVVERAD